MYKIQIITLILAFYCINIVAEDKKKEEEPFKRKTAIKQIKTQIKSDNYSKAYELLTKYESEHTELKDDAEIQNMGVDILYNLTLEENKKIYLKSKPDTTKYLGYIYDMYRYSLRCDSLETVSAKEEKKTKYKYRADNANKMMKFRPNLRIAGNYFYSKGKYTESLKYAEMFISTISTPMSETCKSWHSGAKGNDANIVNLDSVCRKDSINMSKLAVLSGYASGQYNRAIHYLRTAISDTLGRTDILELGIKSYLAIGDTTTAIKYLENAVAYYPQRGYYYVTLISIYDLQRRYEDALKLTNAMIKANENQHTYWVIKGKEEISLNRPDSAISSFKRALELKPTDAESASNIGIIILSKIHEAQNKANYVIGSPKFTHAKQKFKAQYAEACNYLEQSKTNAPESPEMWLTGLRECYFQLNKGKELKALDEITVSETKK